MMSDGRWPMAGPMSMSTHAAGNLDLAGPGSAGEARKGTREGFVQYPMRSFKSQKGHVPRVGSPREVPVGEGRWELRRAAGAKTTMWMAASRSLRGAVRGLSRSFFTTESVTSFQGHRGTRRAGSKLPPAKARCGLSLSNQFHAPGTPGMQTLARHGQWTWNSSVLQQTGTKNQPRYSISLPFLCEADTTHQAWNIWQTNLG